MIGPVALHEAAHSVVATVLGLGLDSATVVPTPAALGLVKYAATQAADEAASEQARRNRIVAALAGRAAQGDGCGCQGDHDVAWTMARALVGDDPADAPTVGRVIADCWAECLALTSRYHNAIADVARSLDLFGTLEGAHLTRVVEQAIASCHYWEKRDAARRARPEQESA